MDFTLPVGVRPSRSETNDCLFRLVTRYRFPKLTEYFVLVLVKSALSTAVVVLSFLCLSEIFNSTFWNSHFQTLCLWGFPMLHVKTFYLRAGKQTSCGNMTQRRKSGLRIRNMKKVVLAAASSVYLEIINACLSQIRKRLSLKNNFSPQNGCSSVVQTFFGSIWLHSFKNWWKIIFIGARE